MKEDVEGGGAGERIGGWGDGGCGHGEGKAAGNWDRRAGLCNHLLSVAVLSYV